MAPRPHLHEAHPRHLQSPTTHPELLRLLWDKRTWPPEIEPWISAFLCCWGPRWRGMHVTATPASPGEPAGPRRAELHQGISFGMLPGSMPAKWGNLSCTGRSQPLRPQPPPGPLFTQLGQISHRGDRCPHTPSPSLPCPKEFVSHSRGRAINVSPPRVCSVRGDSVACHHGSCCLLPDCPRAPGACQCLPTPGAGARGKSPSTLETVAAPSPGGTQDAVGGDGPRSGSGSGSGGGRRSQQSAGVLPAPGQAPLAQVQGL